VSPQVALARVRWALQGSGDQPLYEFDATYTLALFDGGDFLAGDAAAADHFVVADPDPAFADRSHGEFWLVGDSKLAHHDHVERRAERRSDLEGDRHAAAREPEHHRVAAAQPLEGPGQVPPRIGPVHESHQLPPGVLAGLVS